MKRYPIQIRWDLKIFRDLKIALKFQDLSNFCNQEIIIRKLNFSQRILFSNFWILIADFEPWEQAELKF